MNNEGLVMLRMLIIKLVNGCADEDLLDLVCKLFLECGVKAEG